MNAKTRDEFVQIGIAALGDAIMHTCFDEGRAEIDRAINAGMIPKDQLVHGATYMGTCRNAGTAVWDAERDTFVIMRTKFGDTFPEDTPYPNEGNRRFDVFIPLLKVEGM